MNTQANQKTVMSTYSVAISTIAKFSGLTVNEIRAGIENRK